ncbi:cobalamin biosynthesis protein precorrin-6Y C5,15-methyltransferase [Swaminathania salitolerans LMG 21291]|uniref:Precorrin-6Y methyltransferase n=1 Tax=Swaminathania salitolerans TaxID=182838 RepID=A0A511BL71_9PROT|nr:cobalamin biosynthesis protein precorrin-6Y C5,15-methyltransferase [Swaminathania salitolerans LMG 21291]GEL00995.1 precorrin-6Y methyltransferase [Swaminathania salitolerans]
MDIGNIRQSVAQESRFGRPSENQDVHRVTASPHPHGTGSWLTVIGLGEDGFEALSASAQRAIETAEILMGGQRHLALVEGHGSAQRVCWPRPFSEGVGQIASWCGRRVVVLASGDPFCFGAGSVLREAFGAAALRVIPAPSALTLACARLGWSAQDVTLASLCGRPIARLRPLLQPRARLLVLSADETTPARLCAWLCEQRCGASRIHVLEALGGARERIRVTRADEGVSGECDRLNMVAVQIVPDPDAALVPLSAGLPDHYFEHDGQMTKREMRAVTLSSLAPRAGEMLWDLGAGSGSIAIEWMLRHPANAACAVERDPERVARILRNAEALGVPELHVEHRTLPCALDDLPRPDAVFVGGGVATPALLDLGWSALSPGGRLVANAVTMEGEQRLFEAFQAWGGALSRIAMERLGPIGDVSAFRPAMTVTQYRVVKP